MQVGGRRSSSCQGRSSRGGYHSSPDSSTDHGQRSKQSTSRLRSFKVAAARPFFSCFAASSVNQPQIHQNEFSKASTSTAATHFGSISLRDTKKSGGQGNTDFSMQDIFKATGNFSEINKIGEGHFGTIYKGRLRDGTVVAVKRAKKNVYEMHASTEFKNEIKTLSRIDHLNLVRFWGYLEQANERIIVVEFVGNGNLRSHLSGSHGRVLEIADRLQIAIDTAHAVTYLHTYTDHPIIHRDIKSTNILITKKYRAKVADFGFARLAAEDPEATHVITQIKGTIGYLDPEYLKTFELTEKSDVYSFGVVLVELVTGRHPIESKQKMKRMTTTWVIQKHNQGNTGTVMDPNLRRSPESIAAVEKILDLARQCLAPSRRYRPSMKKCAEILWKIRKDFQELKVHNTSCSAHHKEECQFKRDSSDKQEISVDLSSTSSSTKWGMKLVREGAAWDMDAPAHRRGMGEASPSYDVQVTQPNDRESSPLE